MSRTAFGEVRWLPETDSTNRLLLSEARSGAPAGLVVAADHQTAGRGRLGRRWEAPPGACLLASVLVRPVLAPEHLFLCTGALALAAADACADVADVRPALKWPNDLVVGDAKLAGVLAESDDAAPGGPPGSVAVVVGIGLNVDWPGPPDVDGTSLRLLGAGPVDRRTLLNSLLGHLGPRTESLGAAAGRLQLVEELRRRCCTLGRTVRVERGHGMLRGRAVDLSDLGSLVVEDAGVRTEVSAGDVVHLRPGE